MLLPKVSKQVSFAFRRGTALAAPREYVGFRGQTPDKNGVLWGGGWVVGEEHLKTMAFLMVFF